MTICKKKKKIEITPQVSGLNVNTLFCIYNSKQITFDIES